jgi:maltooligosyltrehalose trehalohydrolase
VVCLQNHVQIGNRAMGERLTSLAHPEALRVAAALLLLSPTIPLIFMGEEWGTQRPFLFFTDHNEELAEAVRVGRRREFAHFAAFADEARRERIPDPNAASTFEQSLLENDDERNTPMLELYRSLLALRQSHVVPGIEGCRSEGARAIGPKAVFGQWRLGDGRMLTIAANFGDDAVEMDAVPGDAIFQLGDSAGSGRLGARAFVAWLAHAA